MKLGVRLVTTWQPKAKELAGDLRELLGLKREEEDITALTKQAESGLRELEQKIARAPLDVRGPLAEALHLPYKASPTEIALEVPKMEARAQQLAENHMQRGRSEIIGEGKLLSSDMEDASDEELTKKLQELFSRYLQKILARVVTPLDSFTRPPEEFRCSWAD